MGREREISGTQQAHISCTHTHTHIRVYACSYTKPQTRTHTYILICTHTHAPLLVGVASSNDCWKDNTAAGKINYNNNSNSNKFLYQIDGMRLTSVAKVELLVVVGRWSMVGCMLLSAGVAKICILLLMIYIPSE